jgi:hypothetical protein
MTIARINTSAAIRTEVGVCPYGLLSLQHSHIRVTVGFVEGSIGVV